MDQLEKPARTAYASAMKPAHPPGRLPDFVIIGAMKSATSTLHEQLAAQPGIFMCTPKEPNYFSDDHVFRRGEHWYRGLFAPAAPGRLAGEASTHYTKLPTHPHSVARMRQAFRDVRLVYVMRHPVDRLKSHYLHEVSMGNIRGTLEQAIALRPELVDYGRYAMQLRPFLDAFGRDAVLPVFFDRLVSEPQGQLERICAFIGYRGKPRWNLELRPSNVSSDRMRRLPFESLLIRSRFATSLRRALVPRGWREIVKQRLRVRDGATVTQELRLRLEQRFDEDLELLGDLLGCELSCRNFKSLTGARDLDWRPKTVQPQRLPDATPGSSPGIAAPSRANRS